VQNISNSAENLGEYMFNPSFDPLEALEKLNENQIILNQNQHNHAKAIQHLLERVNEQQQVIDTLVKGLDASNKANELMLQSLVSDINKSLKETSNG